MASFVLIISLISQSDLYVLLIILLFKLSISIMLMSVATSVDSKMSLKGSAWS